jgi:chromosome segregation ATPase
MNEQKDRAQVEAEELLPCEWHEQGYEHVCPEANPICYPCRKRPAVAAKLRELYVEIKRLREKEVWLDDQNGIEQRQWKLLAEKDAEIDKLKGRSENWKKKYWALADRYDTLDADVTEAKDEVKKLKAENQSHPLCEAGGCQHKIEADQLQAEVEALRLTPDSWEHLARESSRDNIALRAEIERYKAENEFLNKGHDHLLAEIEKLKAEKLAEAERVTKRDVEAAYDHCCQTWAECCDCRQFIVANILAAQAREREG